MRGGDDRDVPEAPEVGKVLVSGDDGIDAGGEGRSENDIVVPDRAEFWMRV
jgi:hypothetical protein